VENRGAGGGRIETMNRTERLFALMDVLRRHRRPVTAARLADELGVSLRTVYRDVQVLIGLGAPIDGEAGLGYVLRPGFFLPPLMFSEDELEALVLGAQWIARQNDTALTEAASNALAKIAAASPKDLRDAMANTGLWVAPVAKDAKDRLATERPADVGLVREAIRREHKLHIAYVAETGAPSERAIWPIALAFFERRQTVAAWCELRSAFRHFRIDRITALAATGERYPKRRADLVKAWQREANIPE
jgi:predicted DNA-binding transcriptional regulator YafY